MGGRAMKRIYLSLPMAEFEVARIYGKKIMFE